MKAAVTLFLWGLLVVGCKDSVAQDASRAFLQASPSQVELPRPGHTHEISPCVKAAINRGLIIVVICQRLSAKI